MKNFLKPLVLGIVLLSASGKASAATQTFSNNQTFTESGVSFTFTQFNASLGSLSAIDLIINSSVPSGSVSFTKTGAGSSTYQSLFGGLAIYDPFTLDTYFDNGTSISLVTTPNAGNGTFNSASASANKTFTLSGGQSLIASIPTTSSISNTYWGNFIGNSQIQLEGIFNALASASGNNVSPNYSNLSAPTSLTLQYTYTPTSAVPEPGQVAASILLLGGIGVYLYIKRRRPSAAHLV